MYMGSSHEYRMLYSGDRLGSWAFWMPFFLHCNISVINQVNKNSTRSKNVNIQKKYHIKERLAQRT